VIYGREKERAKLREILEDAIASGGSLVLISGEAGIGKTTLVRWVAHEAQKHGAFILSGGCYDLTTTPPYGPWTDATRGYQPTSGQPPVPAWSGNSEELGKVGSQTALFEEARRFFAAIADGQPLVIVLEDLHWADSASLEALRYLGRTLADSGVLLVITYRDDEITRRHELYQLLPLLVRESQTQRIHLGQLDHDDIREMVEDRYELGREDLARLVDYVAERSEGNPFFASEMLQGLEDERVLQAADAGWLLGNLERAHVPSLLRQALDVRLSRLSPDTRSALRVAAVIGQIVPIDLWQALAELDEERFEQAMTDALEAHVLEEAATATTLQFRHALLREALYESLTLSRRHAWHRQVGDALVATPNPDPDEVAHHFLEAGDPRAVAWLMRAGVRAEGSYAWRVAVTHYEIVHKLLQSMPEAAQARGWLLLHIGHLLRWTDRRQSLAYLEKADDAAALLDDQVLPAYARWLRGLLLCFQSEIEAGVREMGSSVAAMDQVSAEDRKQAHQAIASLFPDEIFADPRLTSGSWLFNIGHVPGINTLTQSYVMWLALAGRFRDAIRIGEPLIDKLAAATDDALVIQNAGRDAYYGLAVAAEMLGQPEAARHWRALALAAYEVIGHHLLIGGIHHLELNHLLTYQTERIAERRRTVQAITTEHARFLGHNSVEEAEQAGGAGDHMGRSRGVRLDLIEGRWAEARGLALATVHDDFAFAQEARLLALGTLGREQGDPDQSWEQVRMFHPEGPASEPGASYFAAAVEAQRLAVELLLDAGDLEQARAWLHAHDRWLESSGAVLGQAEGHLLWARYQRLAGEPNPARQHAERALEHAATPRQPLALIAAHRLLGQLETEAGQYAEAAEHLEASLELAEQCAAPYEQALTKLERAELAARTGEPAEARRLLREVRGICQSLNAKRSLERADRIEARLRTTATTYPAGLSSREVEVLELAAEGMTNTAIGEQLYISRRTVAQHLRSVYNKLGVNSRAAAVARWADLNRG
jgi:DNA-binding CsgD family transcriptional regulator/anti-anti-sigma regulatory factor